jgi:Uncharacterized ABC-type transport system, permease component
MNWETIFNTSLVYATFRSATPIIYAALCAAITQKADILNIGTEGIMLTGAFFAVAVSFLTHSWILGVVVAMAAGLVISMIMAVGHIRFKADICAIGMGINLFAIAITKFLLNSVLGKRGTFSDPGIVPIPRVHIKAFDSIAVLNTLFNNWAVTEWLVIVLIIVIWFVFYKTKWGLHLRAVGQFPMAAQTAGINVTAIKYEAIAISGLIGGLAGAHLSLGYSALFTENMTNSRGFMGVAAMFFGNADPVWTSVGCLVFGFADSVGNRLQAHGWPSQIVLLMPYAVTIAVLAVSMASKIYADRRKKSSLLSAAA